MRRILDQYCKNNWLNVWLPDNSDLLFYFDNMLYYHDKHLQLRKTIEDQNNKIIKEMVTNQGLSDTTKTHISNLANKQWELNKYIRAFFTLSIVELSKIFKENKEFKKYINDKIYVYPYERLYRWNPKNISCLSDMIVHFRDACTHSQTEEISKRPEFKEYNINWKDIHLDFTCDWKTSEWVFMIWHWVMKFKDFENVIKETLTYIYLKN